MRDLLLAAGWVKQERQAVMPDRVPIICCSLLYQKPPSASTGERLDLRPSRPDPSHPAVLWTFNNSSCGNRLKTVDSGKKRVLYCSLASSNTGGSGPLCRRGQPG